MNDPTISGLITTTLAAPTLACAALALPSWFGAKLRERVISGIVGAAFAVAAVASAAALTLLLLSGEPLAHLSFGHWFDVGHYDFHITLIADHLSLPFALFVALLVGLIGAFSRRYLHRERGFLRFYLLLALFGASVELVALAGSLDLVFFGWELVGLTSVLLIAFFHERPKPVEHGLRAFLTYRMCDVGLLGALIWLHHTAGTTAFEQEHAPWAGITPVADAGAAMLIGFLLLWASMGKSAQVPLSGWLPRAMEGPTPSSAIFYGSISIHLGPFLLLRAAPVLMQTPAVAWSVIAIGALTALHGSFVGRVQTDIKSVLAYASMTQVGLILVEIGFGLHYLPLLHIIGHATVRSLEILRSPSLLHDHHHLEQAIGRQVARAPVHVDKLLPRAWQPWLYRHALERGYFDGLLRDFVVRPFLAVWRGFDRADRWLADLLAGRDPESPPPEERAGGAR